MFNLQGSEIIFILLLALVVLGPEKLPGAIRRFTKTYAELRKMGTSFQDEVKQAFDEPMREVRETADLIKQQVDVEALEAEADASEALDESAARARREQSDDFDSAGMGQNPATAPDPFAPPVAGTARPGPSATTAPAAVPPPPPPFAGSSGPARPTADDPPEGMPS